MYVTDFTAKKAPVGFANIELLKASITRLFINKNEKVLVKGEFCRVSKKNALKCDTINTNTGGSITPQKALHVLERLAWGKKATRFEAGDQVALRASKNSCQSGCLLLL